MTLWPYQKGFISAFFYQISTKTKVETN